MFSPPPSDDSGSPPDSPDNPHPTPSRPKSQSSEDAKLISQIKSGDKSSFEFIYRRYYAPMVAFATPFVHDVEIARDLVGDLFLTIWQKRQEWDVQTSIATYLYQALRHRASNVQRDAGVDARNVSRAAAAGISLGTAKPSVSADEDLLRRERVDRLWQAVSHLSEPRRTIVVLRWREQMSFDDIATVVGTSPAAVQMQLSRALKSLRDLLAEIR